MTVTTETALNSYIGAGTTGPFAYTFKIFDPTNLHVVVTTPTGSQTQLNYPADFSVTGAGDRAGGTITLVVALTSGYLLTIARVLAIKQLMDLRNLGPTFPASFEDALDYSTMILQQINGNYAQQVAVVDDFVGGVDYTAGTTTQLTLSQYPGAVGTLIVMFDTGTAANVQRHATYSVSGKTVTFNAAIPANVTHVEIQYLAIATFAGIPANTSTGMINVRDHGAKGDGSTDDTSAIGAAITLAAATSPLPSNVYFPPGQYVVKSQLTVPTVVSIVGDGSGVSVIIFAPTADGTCLKISAGAAVSLRNQVRGIGFYSADTTHTKVALELSDVSGCVVNDIYVFGAGTGTPNAPYWTGGTGSIGLRTKGREASWVNNVRLIADKPIVIAANPNTAPTDGEDCDHWHFSNCYLLGKGSYCIQIVDGLGASNLTFDGYQAWVGGVGGFTMNDTRNTPTVPSRLLRFANVRTEQCTDADGYAFLVVSAGTGVASIQSLDIVNALLASGSQGISITNVLQARFAGVIAATAAGKHSLLTAGALGGATMDLIGCYWQPASLFTPTGYNLILAPGFDASVSVGPSTALYANVIAGSQALIEKITAFAAAGTRSFFVQASANGDAMTAFANAAGSGANLQFVNSSATDYAPGIFDAKTFTWNVRTGVGTKALAAQIDTALQLALSRRFFPAKDDGTVQTVAGIYAGNGAPNDANGSNGDLYIRGDGTAAGKTVFYHKQGGTWVAAIP